MARDGSSGGVIRLVVIDQSGIEKEVVLGKRYFIYFSVFILSFSLLSIGNDLPYMPYSDLNTM